MEHLRGRISFLIPVLLCLAVITGRAQQPYVPDDPVLPAYLRQVTLWQPDGRRTTLGTVLDSLRGKVVYVDFWASWCGPCLHEMPYSLELQHRFAEKEVEFLYLSTNTDDKSWKKGLERIRLPGHHYRIEPLEKARFRKYFRIPGIPFYLILDREGKVFLADAPWPSDSRAARQIEKALRHPDAAAEDKLP